MKLSTHGKLVGIGSLKDLSGRIITHQSEAVKIEFSIEETMSWMDDVRKGQYIGTAWFVIVFLLTAYLLFGLNSDIAGVLVVIFGYLVPFLGIGFYVSKKGTDPAFFKTLEV